jgi:hypothetical protein
LCILFSLFELILWLNISFPAAMLKPTCFHAPLISAKRSKRPMAMPKQCLPLFRVFLSKGNVDLAAELANTVDDPFTRDKLLIIVAEKCADIDDDEYALQLIDTIEDHGLHAEGRERIGILKAGKGQFEIARRIGDEMLHPDYVFSSIAIKQFADGNAEAAQATIGEIEFPGARVSAYIHTASGKIALGETEGVETLLDAAAADASEIEHDEEKIRSVIEIGTLFLEAEQNGKAIETF